MKKINLLLFSIISILLCIGCTKNKTENKFDDFEHFDLKEKSINSYTFEYNNEKDTYAVADITISEYAMNGLFYQTAPNDYILLDDIDSCGDVSDATYKNDRYTYFYQDEVNHENKLFIDRCVGLLLIEYTLNNENFEKRLLKFNTSKISDNSLEYVMLTSIKKVEHDYIYFYATIHNTNSIDIPVKCSLSTLECELIEFSDW